MFKSTLVIALTLGSLGATAALAQENYASAWSGHKNVIVNTSATQGGAAVNNNIIGFPVLVRLGTADSVIFNQALATGADLRFTKSNNSTRLPHQIETWNKAGRTAAVWVLMDTVYGNQNAQHIRMHWGNASAADSSNGAKVFGTANGFQAVWHMNGAGDNTNESDATANAFTATAVNSPAATSGMISGGRQFSGSQYLNTTGTETGALNFGYNSSFTISAWINPVELVTHGVIVSKHDRQYALKLDANNNLEFFEFGDGIGWNAVNAFADAGTWRHAVGIQRGAEAELYLDGVRVDVGMVSTASTNARLENIQVVIGAEPTSATAFRRYFNGILDEVRMANVARSADWVRLEHENQKVGATMVKVLDTLPTSISRTLRATDAGFSVKSQSGGLVFNITDKGASKAKVTLVDMWGRTVWAQTADIRNGRPVVWNGRTMNGQPAPQGIYAARISLLDDTNASLRVIDRKVPLTR
jgi:biopolymer transport protein ExbB